MVAGGQRLVTPAVNPPISPMGFIYILDFCIGTHSMGVGSTNKLLSAATNTSNWAFSKGHTIFR